MTPQAAEDPSLHRLLDRRARSMGPTYRLFYDEPLHVVTGRGVWLEDAAGRRYLDAYNNVPVVGHCHPRVVDALSRQAATLNTHTRYANELPVLLAERLLATLPSEFGNVVFTCSGSESNEFACRIAMGVTGATGFIVTAHAYHGTTARLAGMSPSGGRPLGRDVFTVDAPAPDEPPEALADRVRDCIGRMAQAGVRPAGLMVDSVMATDGVVVGPAGCLRLAADAIRAAGGLSIADEVQSGFGRCGAMWGFSRHGVVPDIVTMGKPMGNGHPIGALAARREIMAAFAATRGYFNTFGGNTVSCAVGLAVLDVIQDEDLVGHARNAGARFHRRLQGLEARHRHVAVRGAGLFFGVEVGGGDDAAGSRARRVVNAMRRAGVLIGATGPKGSVLKIRPPLPVAEEELDTIVSALDAALHDA
ncbi:Acetylornithine aminotransferase [Methylobacterium crusticola]|uniref:Acetylornithine aminotransferase n=1 Tax=Methylobacterium crusticola TaxID=1697972 RepID=A0ABQ4R5E6_9HYPH|nr:aspartate aminotransferase family protein [Methylobacterium crusticola]GJD52541.1 Acetylornithine aminotransferase [Methylobacterium crusticola]